MTESVCPVCLARIAAHHVQEGDDVYLEKRCEEHGSFRAVVWRGPPAFDAWVGPPRPPSPPVRPATSVKDGCPFDCGLCPDHRQTTCCVLLEVTSRCNLSCHYCFAGGGRVSRDPDRSSVERELRALRDGGAYNVQLSGGEPTLRDDLPEIVELARSLGFDFVQLNTNGVRIANDRSYARRLVDAGLGCVFLQFDALSDEAYLRLRGAPLVATKGNAIARCAELGVGVVLVPTVVPGVNDHALGDIVRFAVARAPAVRGVHFQPVTFLGRYPAPPRDQDRITLPEIMTALEKQTGGMLRVADFKPPSAENARCSFSATYDRGEGGTLRVSSAGQSGCCAPRPGAEARTARNAVARRWLHPETTCGKPDLAPDAHTASLDAFIAKARRDTFSVSGMAFQDAWNVDLERVRECFIHVASGERRVPFCAFNLTSHGGVPLYRNP